MKLCRTCRFGSEYELDKPCIVYREDCSLYEKEGDEMTNKEAIEELKAIKSEYSNKAFEDSRLMRSEIKALDVAIKALEQEPSGDLISREQALKECHKIVIDGDVYGVVQEETLLGLPSVNPQEPKTGHWELKKTFPTKLYDEYLNEYKCSECYREIRCTESQLVNYPYCHCGAKMIEPQEGEVNNG